MQTNRRDLVPSYGAYLPLDRRLELAGFGEVPTLSTGAALFADISGFTALTEELGRTLGARRGAEELSALLNRVFGSVTAAIDNQGGSIISFGGDSVIAWFADAHARPTVKASTPLGITGSSDTSRAMFGATTDGTTVP